MARLRVPLERRFNDLDILGHVNNVTYLVYLEEARVRMRRHLSQHGVQLGDIVVARQEIDYLRPLALRAEPVVLELWIDHVGTTSFTVACNILDDDGTLAARGRSVMVGWNRETEGKAPLAADVVAAFASLVDDQV